MDVGTIIKTLRNEHHMTQEELGSKLNPPVNRQAVNKWETGRVENIKRSHIEQMAVLFGVKPSLFFDCDQDPDMVSTSDLKYALWGGENGMTDEQFREVMQFANFVKERDSKK